MIYVLYFIHIVISIFLILVVLLQQGKGADLSVFGGGASQAAFGARGAASLLHKLTVAGFVMFILTTLSIGILQTGSEDSLMRGVAVEEGAEAEAPSATGTAAGEDEQSETDSPTPSTADPEPGGESAGEAPAAEQQP